MEVQFDTEGRCWHNLAVCRGSSPLFSTKLNKMKNKLEKFFFGYDNPINFYEKSPFLSWIIIICFILYCIWGSIVVLL